MKIAMVKANRVILSLINRLPDRSARFTPGSNQTSVVVLTVAACTILVCACTTSTVPSANAGFENEIAKAETAQATQNYAQAAAHLQAAAKISESFPPGDVRHVATLLKLADVDSRTGHPEHQRILLRQAADLSAAQLKQKSDEQWIELAVESHQKLAKFHVDLGETRTAGSLYKDAIAFEQRSKKQERLADLTSALDQVTSLERKENDLLESSFEGPNSWERRRSQATNQFRRDLQQKMQRLTRNNENGKSKPKYAEIDAFLNRVRTQRGIMTSDYQMAKNEALLAYAKHKRYDLARKLIEADVKRCATAERAIMTRDISQDIVNVTIGKILIGDYVSLANLSSNDKRAREALQFIDKARLLQNKLKLDEQEERLLVLEAQIAESAKDYDKAIVARRQYYELLLRWPARYRPMRRDAALSWQIAALYAENPQEAEKAFLAMMQSDFDHRFQRYMIPFKVQEIGNLYQSTGDSKGAIRFIESNIALTERKPALRAMALDALAQAYLETGNIARAVETNEQCLRERQKLGALTDIILAESRLWLPLHAAGRNADSEKTLIAANKHADELLSLGESSTFGHWYVIIDKTSHNYLNIGKTVDGHFPGRFVMESSLTKGDVHGTISGSNVTIKGELGDFKGKLSRDNINGFARLVGTFTTNVANMPKQSKFEMRRGANAFKCYTEMSTVDRLMTLDHLNLAEPRLKKIIAFAKNHCADTGWYKDGHLKLADLYWLQGRYPQSLESAISAWKDMNVYPFSLSQHLKAFCSMVRCELKLKQTDRAKAHWTRAMQIYNTHKDAPIDEIALVKLAATAQMIGDVENGKILFKHAMTKLNGRSGGAAVSMYAAYSAFLKDLHNDKEALAMKQKALEMNKLYRLSNKPLQEFIGE